MTRTRIVTAGATTIMLAVVALTIYAVDEWWHSELRTKNVRVFEAESYMDIPNHIDVHRMCYTRWLVDHTHCPPIFTVEDEVAAGRAIVRNNVPNTATISLKRYEWSDWSPKLTCSDTN